MWIAPLIGVWIVGALIVVVALWPAPRTAVDPLERGARWTLVAALLTVPLGPAVLLHADRPLPVELSSDAWFALAPILLLVRVALPALAWHASTRLPLPMQTRGARGKAAMLVALTTFALFAGVALARVHAGGVSAEAFAEPGHLTPGPASGARITATIEQHAIPGTRARPAREVLLPPPPPAPPPPPPGYPLRPNRFDWSLGEFELCFYACEPPPPPPPHLAGWDTWRPARDDQVVLLRGDRGHVEAMLVDDVLLEPVALDVRDVWRFVRPPLWPLALACAIAIGGAWLGAATRRRHVATWMIAEATALVVFGYATYLGG